MSVPPPLLPTKQATHFIRGSWTDRETQVSIDAVSPATGETLGAFARGTSADVDRAVDGAASAASGWAHASLSDRTAALTRLAEEIERRRSRLALLLALEQGKPLHSEADEEVDEALGNIALAIDCAKRLDGFMPPSVTPDKRALVYRVPRGVVAAIQPWNYPLGLAMGQIAPALIVGNTVVSMPAPTTSLVAHELAECFEAAELPAGVFNLVTGYGHEIGDALTAHPGVDVIAFTGSTATGMRVARSAAGKVQLLELGGNGPFVVLEDANLEHAAREAVLSSFMCAGQVCTAGERFLVHDAVYDEFADLLVSATESSVRLGHPLDEQTTMGPLNNEQAAVKVDEHVDGAVAQGATAITGGRRASSFPTDLYWPPTIVTDVTESMEISREETFGPVAPLERIASEQDALERIDRAQYGLAAAVFTDDLRRGLRFAERAPVGTVNINGASVWSEGSVPAGGRSGKSSGIGRNHPRFAIEESFTEYKTIFVDLSEPGGA